MLHIKPISLKVANKFVEDNHRHHGPTVGHKFSVAVADDDEIIRGVAIVGRPVSRKLDNGEILEVNRLCTDGTYNACSMLYGAAARVAKEMGYKKIITYILESEPGTSLKAAGYKNAGTAGGLVWTGKRKQNNQKYPKEMKTRYEKELY